MLLPPQQREWFDLAAILDTPANRGRGSRIEISMKIPRTPQAGDGIHGYLPGEALRVVRREAIGGDSVT